MTFPEYDPKPYQPNEPVSQPYDTDRINDLEGETLYELPYDDTVDRINVPTSLIVPPETYGDEEPTSISAEAHPQNAREVRAFSDLKEEGEHATNDVEVPDNIHELLATGLTPANMPGTATQKLNLEGHPDLLVRVVPGETPQQATAAKEARDALTPHGVNVLPSTPVEHDGKMYLVTKRVDGLPLADALANNPSPQLLEQVDKTWQGLSTGLVEAHTTDGAFPLDITTPDQYMVGSIAGDPEAKVWLVDLTDSAAEVLHTQSPGEFEIELLEIANGLKKAEGLADSQLPMAREAIHQAQRLCQSTQDSGNGIAEAVKWVLKNDIELYIGFHDEIISRLRTDEGAPDRTPPPNGLDTAGYDAATIEMALIYQKEDSGLPPGNTEKYTLRNDPDIILRLDPGVPLEEMEAAKQAADAMQGYGVNVLPSDVLMCGEAVYVATLRVEGPTLQEALANNPSDELIDQVDTAWEGLAEALIGARLHNKETPKDVSGVEQFMVGTTSADNTPKIWLVDLPWSAAKANNGDIYESALTWLAGNVIEIEHLIGRELPRAREAIEIAIMLCRNSNHYGDGLQQAIGYMLDNSTIVRSHDEGPDEDLIQELRTI